MNQNSSGSMVVLKKTPMTLRKDQIDYPSKENPRVEGLNVTDKKMIELAESIRKNGLLVPILVCQKPDGQYDTLDGDRRTISVFDILGYDEIPAECIEMPEVLDRYILRMVANQDRQGFSSLEKGRYIHHIMETEAKQNGLTIEEVWNNRNLRSDYLLKFADKLGTTSTSASRWVNVWRSVPEKDRSLIARTPEELRTGHKISPSKAAKILQQGRQVGNQPIVWRSYIPDDAVENKKQISVSSTELDILGRKISEGTITDADQYVAARNNKEADEWTTMKLFLKKTEEKQASKTAASLGSDIQRVIRASILLSSKNQSQLNEVLKEEL